MYLPSLVLAIFVCTWSFRWPWSSSILKLFADVLGTIYSKNPMMMIWKAWYHHWVLLRMQCCHCQWHTIITGKIQLCCWGLNTRKQQNLSGIGCFTLHQEKKNLIIILTNPSWILVLEVINMLYVQWTGMRWLTNSSLALMEQYFITSSSGWSITLVFIHLLVNK